jgi:REP element-mobilizing transposase RayT
MLAGLPQHFVRVTLDAMVIMPDHLHGIIVIGEAPDIHASPKALSANGTRPDSLAAMIQNFKSISTRRVNQLRNMAGSSLWQRNYYERIIRDEAELIAVRRYIVTNPVHAFARMKQSEQKLY